MRRPGLALIGTGTAFTAVYYGLRALASPLWLTDALLVLPALLATTLLWRRSLAADGARWHWRLLALGPALWAAGDALWAALELAGYDVNQLEAWQLPLPLPLDALFIGFLAPMLAALALGPRPGRLRADPIGATDAAAVTVIVAGLFVRVVAMPRLGDLPQSIPGLLLGAETFLLACWALAGARRAADVSARWSLLFVALFALSYGILSSLANGWAGEWSVPGGVADVAWILPFFLLAAAALPPRPLPAVRAPQELLLLFAGPIPLLGDLMLDRVLPTVSAGGHEAHVLLFLPLGALVAVATAVRLALGQRADRRSTEEWRLKVEEARRAAWLTGLASMSGAMLSRLRRAVGEVVRCAEAAAPSLRGRARLVLENARGAETIVSMLEAALVPFRHETRSVLDLGQLLEESVRVALEYGPSLDVRIEGLDALDAVVGDPIALPTAILQLVANAAEASPGGKLRIHAEREAEDVVLRFSDDGPGVRPEIQAHIFDPFFTTGPPGQAVGLGLTLVHSVARSHRGSIVLEPSAQGATFALRLPALRPPGGAARHWGAVASLAVAALAGSAVFSALSRDPRALEAAVVASLLLSAFHGLHSRYRLRRRQAQEGAQPPR